MLRCDRNARRTGRFLGPAAVIIKTGEKTCLLLLWMCQRSGEGSTHGPMFLTRACGWIYAIAWGLSFYPALYLHYSLKTSDSVSLDYLCLNIVGYACYSVSLYLQIHNPSVIAQFMVVFDGRKPILSSADLFYSFHGLFMLLIILSQIVLGEQIWGFRNERVHFRIHRLTKLVFCTIALFLVVSMAFGDENFKLLTLALGLAYFKILISLIKYIPQMIHNCKRKTMYGVSKLQLTLDVVGAVFCMLEFLLKNDLPLWKAVEANRGKVGIALVTFVFSGIFSYQVYIYGSEPEFKEKKKEELLV